MNHIKIVNWVMQINDELFDEMKTILLEKYIEFSIIDNDAVAKDILCEKLCDSIEKTLIKTGKSFDELMNYYMDSFGNLIWEYLEKECIGRDSKGKPVYTDSRAIRYYNQAVNKRNDREHPFIGLEDYSRIVFCLYSAIIENKHQPITNFDFSLKSVKSQMVINSLEAEEEEKKFLKFKLQELNKRFKSFHRYSADYFFMIMTIMMLYHLKNKEVRGEY